MPTTKEKFQALAARIDAFWLLDTRQQRLRQYPIRTIKNALIRRAIHFSVDLGLMGKVTRAKTFWGERVSIPSGSSFHLLEKGFLEGEDFRLTGFIMNNVKEGDTFIDGGASFGWYTMIASELVGGSGRVHSFEPTTRTFRVLTDNAKKRNNVTINHLALWDKEEVVAFNDFGPHYDVGNTILNDRENIEYYDLLFTNNKERRVVPTRATTVDAYCAEHDLKPDFIKLDCEGVEYHVLEGAKKILRRCHPIVAIEILRSAAQNGKSAKLIAFLEKEGYKGHSLRDDFSLGPLEAPGASDLINAVFIPAG